MKHVHQATGRGCDALIGPAARPGGRLRNTGRFRLGRLTSLSPQLRRGNGTRKSLPVAKTTGKLRIKGWEPPAGLSPHVVLPFPVAHSPLPHARPSDQRKWVKEAESQELQSEI